MKNLLRLPDEMPSTELLHKEFSNVFSPSGKAVVVHPDEMDGYEFINTPEFLHIRFNGDDLHAYHQALFAHVIQPEIEVQRAANQFNERTLLLDAARNAVPRESFITSRLQAVLTLCGIDLGLNILDVKMPEYPLIGYQRGTYTLDQITRLRGRLRGTGISLIPYLQVLTHCDQFRIGLPSGIKESDALLNVNSPELLPFLRNYLGIVLKAFDAPRFSIGSDEPWGLGKSLPKEWSIDTAGMYALHLANVHQMLQELGFANAEMWGDVLANEQNGTGIHLSPVQARKIAAMYKVTHWDYGTEDAEVYRGRIREFKEKGIIPGIAVGAWDWIDVWCDMRKAEANIAAGMAAARAENLDRVTLTSWGDDGAMSPRSALIPIIGLFCLHTQFAQVTPAMYERATQILTNTSLEAYRAVSRLNCPEALGNCSDASPNFLYATLFDDVILRPYLQQYMHHRFGGEIQAAAQQIEALVASDTVKDQQVWRYAQSLLRYTAIKADLGNDAYRAYQSRDSETLSACIERITDGIKALGDLSEERYRLWVKENNVHGYEVLEARFGADRQRLLALQRSITAYLEDGTPIEEYEEPLQHTTSNADRYSHQMLLGHFSRTSIFH
jgi:hypothetical protein